jgi:hypothetical protein
MGHTVWLPLLSVIVTNKTTQSPPNKSSTQSQEEDGLIVKILPSKEKSNFKQRIIINLIKPYLNTKRIFS